MRNDASTSRAAKRSQAEAGEWICTVCNYLNKPEVLDNVNYEYYIFKAEKLIKKIMAGGKRVKTVVSPNQLNLFV